MRTPIYGAADTAEHLEYAGQEDKEQKEDKEQSRLEADLRRLELRKQELKSASPVYDSRLRQDSRFPNSAGNDAGAGTQNDRLSLAGDEPPVT